MCRSRIFRGGISRDVFVFQVLGVFQGLFSGILQCELNKLKNFRRGCQDTPPHPLGSTHDKQDLSHYEFLLFNVLYDSYIIVVILEVIKNNEPSYTYFLFSNPQTILV